MERRQFLQGLGILGLSYSSLGQQVAWAANQYQQKLSRSGRRKLALLIGINEYEAKGEWLPLNGCVTDVELQRQLLIDRFGFLASDILTLTNQQATRSAITQAVQEHLISQALAGDLVVLHFSGHGSQVGKYKTLVPVNASQFSSLDLSLAALQQCLGQVSTEQVTCVIDAGYRHPGEAIVGNFRIRSRPGQPDLQLLEPELKLPQGQNISILQASDRFCADGNWRGFSSGIFTYALTQQLWQTTEPRFYRLIMPQVLDALDQQAFSPSQVNPTGATLPSPNLITELAAADGAILSQDDPKACQIWLGGLPISALNNYGAGSIFGCGQARLQVRSRDGLIAKAEILNPPQPLQPGQLVQEQVRALAKDLGLIIALDQKLAKIERIDAMGAIAQLGNMTGVLAGEAYADCIFGTESNSYGLFTLARKPILGSFGAVSESVGAAIRRLRPNLEGLLAAKLIQFSHNQSSSGIGLSVKLEARRGEEPLAIASFCQSTCVARQDLVPDPSRHAPLVVGDRLSCHLENQTTTPLYLQIFSFDPRGKMITPSFVIAPYANDGILPPQQSLVIPHPNAPISWTVAAPRGLVKLQIVASRQPLNRTTSLRERYAGQATSPTSMIAIPNPLEVAQALLEDLDQPSLNPGDDKSWYLDTQTWASLGITYLVA
ncbi:MAG: caspase family protein [Pseudanabaenaceae cyanobacterium bins.68]|nr:caspase family protein [Pseudanabaenaceae cyanobacterium bins.68]